MKWTTWVMFIITSRVRGRGNIFGSVRLSVCLFALSLLNCWTYEPNLRLFSHFDTWSVPAISSRRIGRRRHLSSWDYDRRCEQSSQSPNNHYMCPWLKVSLLHMIRKINLGRFLITWKEIWTAWHLKVYKALSRCYTKRRMGATSTQSNSEKSVSYQK